MITLDKRLAACASLVRGNCVADIGTDHAYIPIFLSERDMCTRVIASDVNEGPVRSAREHIAEAGLGSRIEVIRADGLDDHAFDGCDCVIIAGMGGELIVRILEQSSLFGREGVTFVLQPMTKAECVRTFLWDSGYTIEDDICILDGGHIYQIMRTAKAQDKTEYTECEALVGKKRTDEGYRALVRDKIEKLGKRTNGLESAGIDASHERKLQEELLRLL